MKKFGISLAAVVLCRSCAGKLTPCSLVQRWVFSLQASNFGGGDLVFGLTELSGFGCQQLEVCHGEKGGFPPPILVSGGNTMAVLGGDVHG